ncbi:hypothetical protein N7495_007616 [Penicillium taxi]|uniref:uncharacterized protein n=1 Tax=Penicillium taxi TaxID=168475 RepID=UPI00254585F5|nr:uncharacterized protein N7495_007616 [Penicillium taxi]KAJ5887575.1 hypothetical protein N7495_007616 [Penicillium taxi]
MFQSVVSGCGHRATGKNLDCRFHLPGYGRPLDFAPMEKNVYGVEGRSMFPSALDDRDIERGQPVQTLRELAMVRVMERITDISEWWIKIKDPDTINVWKARAVAGENEITENGANWIIEELTFKAIIYEMFESVTLYSGDVTKSDTNVPSSLVLQLRDASRMIEFHDTDLQFYNPDAKKQRDLLDMALYPLIYGKSRILPDKIIGLKDAIQYAGKGDIIPIPKESTITREDMAWRVASRADIEINPYSRDFQILPSDFELGEDGKWHIISYINNLHPVTYRNVYTLIEEAFNCMIPQWNMTMTPLKDMLHSRSRIEYHQAEYTSLTEEVKATAPRIQENEAQSAFDERYEKWAMENYKVVQPDVGQFIPWAVPECMMSKLPADLPTPVRIERGVDLNKEYKDRGLQVIIRIMGVDLTPEDPFHTSPWHVECAMNEHICAAAFLTVDSVNMLAPGMDFRNIVDTSMLAEVEHEPNDFVWLKQVFGLENGEPAVQISGTIRCTPGRVVMFPATVQHRMNKFELEDKTQPGYARLLAFFLVDPNIRVISTANIPPQRFDWTLEQKNVDTEGVTAAVERLAFENKDIKGEVVSLSEALEIRLDVLNGVQAFMKYQQVAFESKVLML